MAESGPNPIITVPRTVRRPGAAGGGGHCMSRTRILVAAAGFGNAGGPASRAIIVTRDSESSRVTSQSRRETVTPGGRGVSPSLRRSHESDSDTLALQIRCPVHARTKMVGLGLG